MCKFLEFSGKGSFVAISFDGQLGKEQIVSIISIIIEQLSLKKEEKSKKTKQKNKQKTTHTEGIHVQPNKELPFI